MSAPGGSSCWRRKATSTTRRAALPAAPPWPGVPPGAYFGLITGPNESHGGSLPADRGWIRQIQQALIRKHYVPGVTDPASPWASGTYTKPTREAVLRFQQAAGRPRTGEVSSADWALLLA
jgi:N-acetylmuramoyl-L-alanine amidase